MVTNNRGYVLQIEPYEKMFEDASIISIIKLSVGSFDPMQIMRNTKWIEYNPSCIICNRLQKMPNMQWLENLVQSTTGYAE